MKMLRPGKQTLIISFLLIALFFIASCGQTSDNSTTQTTGNIDEFLSDLSSNSFTVQEGKLQMIPIMDLASEGLVPSCFGNNAGFPYLSFILPPAPGQNPANGQNPPVNYNADDPGNYPANPNIAPPGVAYKLRPDEAIVLIGKTPPKARYFSYRSYMALTENKPGKDYSDVFTTGDDIVGHYHRIFASLGDPLNHLTIKTENTPNGAEGDPFSSNMILIVSASRDTNNRVRQSLEKAGYSSSIINDDIITPELTKMGLEKGKDTFTYLVRAALWEDNAAGQDFLNNADKYNRVFRVTPQTESTANLYNTPELRKRGTGQSEFNIIQSVDSDLETIRQGVLSKFAVSGYTYDELQTDIWIPEGYTGIAQDIDVLAEDRDTVYLRTNDFQLNSDDDFVVVYGVNHETTGKSLYCNFSFYGEELLNGCAGTNSSNFAGTANEYFPSGYGNAGYYYTYRLGRICTSGENCVIVEKSTGNPKGKAYGVDNNKDAFLAFRSYIEKVNKVGPAAYELVYDRAIVFHKNANGK